MFVTTEILFALSSVGLTCVCSKLFGFEGVSIAHLVNYALYWLVMSYFIFGALESQRG